MTVDTFLPNITLTIASLLSNLSSDVVPNSSTSIVESNLRPLRLDTSVNEAIKAMTPAPHIMHAFEIKKCHTPALTCPSGPPDGRLRSFHEATHGLHVSQHARRHAPHPKTRVGSCTACRRGSIESRKRSIE